MHNYILILINVKKKREKNAELVHIFNETIFDSKIRVERK